MLAAGKALIPRLDYFYSFYFGFSNPIVKQQLVQHKLDSQPRHYTAVRVVDPFDGTNAIPLIPTILHGAQVCGTTCFYNGFVFDESDIVTISRSLAKSLDIADNHTRKSSVYFTKNLYCVDCNFKIYIYIHLLDRSNFIICNWCCSSKNFRL